MSSSPGGATATEDRRAALEALAGAIPRERFSTALTTGTGRPPHLTVACREIPAREAEIYADGGWYWWGWGERIATVWDTANAAAAVTGMLRGTGVPAPRHG